MLARPECGLLGLLDPDCTQRRHHSQRDSADHQGLDLSVDSSDYLTQIAHREGTIHRETRLTIKGNSEPNWRCIKCQSEVIQGKSHTAALSSLTVLSHDCLIQCKTNLVEQALQSIALGLAGGCQCVSCKYYYHITSQNNLKHPTQQYFIFPSTP